jgi:ABC-type transport system substrate-binding protein
VFSRSLIGAGGYNWSCYTGDEIETLVEAAVSTNDHNERLALYAQINDFVSEHSIVWPLFSREGVVATRANVDGLEVFATGMHLFQNIVISE